MAQTQHAASQKKRSDKQPGKHRSHPRDAEGKRVNVLKNAWKKSGTELSLKAWCRQKLGQTVRDEVIEQVNSWFHNKRANTKKPQLCIGRTRSRVKSGGGPKQPHKDLSGR